MGSILTDLFNDFGDTFVSSTHKNHRKPVDIVEFPTVHKQDSEPFTIIWPDMERGPWIAGGAALRWYQGIPVGENDIDIFCKSAIQAEKVIEEIKSYGRYSVKYESENATTLSYHSPDSKTYWTLQVIKRRYFNSLQEVVDNFDISVCQIGTDGNTWLLNKNTAKDIRERNLRMNMPLHADAAKRMAKYWTYGYRPVDGLLEAVKTNPIAKKVFEIDGDYENAF